MSLLARRSCAHVVVVRAPYKTYRRCCANRPKSHLFAGMPRPTNSNARDSNIIIASRDTIRKTVWPRVPNKSETDSQSDRLVYGFSHILDTGWVRRVKLSSGLDKMLRVRTSLVAGAARSPLLRAKLTLNSSLVSEKTYT